ncbi:hypothetical protein ASD30_00520 [Nocardioides sp. Root140]|nr:hypothetical protein ASD30_00520 [Nocardioides sp. Root140]KRF17512.1 hypothetical protein ASH02_24920 [Nocardioides sp. Soil796]
MSTRFWLYVLDSLLLVPVNLLLLFATVLLPTPVALAVSFLAVPLWFALWWRGLSATPAKMLCRLSIQPALGPGRLTWSVILRRLAAQTGVPYVISTVALLPASAEELESGSGWLLLAVVASWSWILVDCLWALGNPQRQALHDKFAGTVVVERIRR